jgi:hypothetical protein
VPRTARRYGICSSSGGAAELRCRLRHRTLACARDPAQSGVIAGEVPHQRFLPDYRKPLSGTRVSAVEKTETCRVTAIRRLDTGQPAAAPHSLGGDSEVMHSPCEWDKLRARHGLLLRT